MASKQTEIIDKIIYALELVGDGGINPFTYEEETEMLNFLNGLKRPILENSALKLMARNSETFCNLTEYDSVRYSVIDAYCEGYKDGFYRTEYRGKS